MVQARWGLLKLSLDFRGCRVCTLIEVKQGGRGDRQHFHDRSRCVSSRNIQPLRLGLMNHHEVKIDVARETRRR